MFQTSLAFLCLDAVMLVIPHILQFYYRVQLTYASRYSMQILVGYNVFLLV